MCNVLFLEAQLIISHCSKNLFHPKMINYYTLMFCYNCNGQFKTPNAKKDVFQKIHEVYLFILFIYLL